MPAQLEVLEVAAPTFDSLPTVVGKGESRLRTFHLFGQGAQNRSTCRTPLLGLSGERSRCRGPC